DLAVPARVAHRGQLRGEAAALRPRVRRPGLRAGGAQDGPPQRAVAGRDRTARRGARGRAAGPPASPGRPLARHGVLLRASARRDSVCYWVLSAEWPAVRSRLAAALDRDR